MNNTEIESVINRLKVLELYDFFDIMSPPTVRQDKNGIYFTRFKLKWSKNISDTEIKLFFRPGKTDLKIKLPFTASSNTVIEPVNDIYMIDLPAKINGTPLADQVLILEIRIKESIYLLTREFHGIDFKQAVNYYASIRKKCCKALKDNNASEEINKKLFDTYENYKGFVFSLFCIMQETAGRIPENPNYGDDQGDKEQWQKLLSNMLNKHKIDLNGDFHQKFTVSKSDDPNSPETDEGEEVKPGLSLYEAQKLLDDRENQNKELEDKRRMSPELRFIKTVDSMIPVINDFLADNINIKVLFNTLITGLTQVDIYFLCYDDAPEDRRSEFIQSEKGLEYPGIYTQKSNNEYELISGYNGQHIINV